MTPSVVSVGSIIAGIAAAVVAAGPGIRTALSHRGSDNGLAFGLLAGGVVIWTLTGVCQLLAQEPIVQTYFLLLSLIGASVTSLGWFLFASTAGSTPTQLSRRSVYLSVALAIGLNIGFVITIPIHGLYWRDVADAATIGEPGLSAVATGYWVHTLLVAGLCLAGSWLFANATGTRQDRTYGAGYAVCGIAVTVAILMSNVTTPGSGMLAPILAAGLVCIGIQQATPS